ncbi:hypothetical protein [Campylobacter fetus]|nr:hypothetical protein [Campylobacter fetus]
MKSFVKSIRFSQEQINHIQEQMTLNNQHLATSFLKPSPSQKEKSR